MRALARDPAGACDLEAAGIQLAIGDIRDPSALDAAMTGVHTVYHLAAAYRQAAIPEDTYRAVNAVAAGEGAFSTWTMRSSVSV